MRSEPHAEHSEFLIESSLQRRCCAESAHAGANLSQGLFSRSAEHSQFLIESSRLQRCRAEARRWMRISGRVWSVSCHCSWAKILSNTTLPSLLFSAPTVFPLPSLRELLRISYSQSISSFIIQAKKFPRQQNSKYLHVVFHFHGNRCGCFTRWRRVCQKLRSKKFNNSKMLKTKTRQTSKKNLFLRGRCALYASSDQMPAAKALLTLTSRYGIISQPHVRNK